MRKIVINCDFGGFSLSDKVISRMRELGSKEAKECILVGEKHENGEIYKNDKDWNYIDVSRDNPILIKAIEEIGVKKSSGEFACLKIVEIPDDVEWEIEEFNGIEHVREKSRVWF